MAPRRRAVPEPWAEEQRRLAALRVARDDVDWAVHGQFVCGLDRVAGVDVSFFPDASYAVAAVVVLSFSSSEVLYARCAAIRLAVPYIPGYLAFREVPALATLLGEVPSALAPQVVLVDGNGAFHPRRCGAATHLGIITNLPTIGVAKKVLRVDDVNRRRAEQVAQRLRGPSEWAPLGAQAAVREAEEEDEDEEEEEEGEAEKEEPLAMLLRPCSGKGTIVVSAGHRVSLDTAVRLTAALCRAGRVPEPIRQADLQSRAAVREWFKGKELSGLAVKEGLLPALPGLKRPAPEEDDGDEAEAEPSAARAKGRRRRRGAGEEPLSAAPEEAPRAGQKPGGKASLVWRVKAAPREPDGNPRAEPEPVPEGPGAEPGVEGPGAGPRAEAEGSAGKRQKVWRVKAVAADPCAEGAVADACLPLEAAPEEEGRRPEDRSEGLLAAYFVWFCGCCVSRG